MNGEPLGPDALYQQLGQLLAERPSLSVGVIGTEQHRWLARATELLGQSLDSYSADYNMFCTAVEFLHGPMQAGNAHIIEAILHRAWARVEARASTSARGAFIAVGATFDVFQSVGRLFGAATRSLLIVDPYMNPVVLTDFAPSAAEGVVIQLLSDSASTKPELLRPAVERWTQQFGATRPVEARQTAARALHDRYIFVDDKQVWSLTQSLKDFARRSPGALNQIQDDTAALKLDAFRQFWASATPL